MERILIIVSIVACIASLVLEWFATRLEKNPPTDRYVVPLNEVSKTPYYWWHAWQVWRVANATELLTTSFFSYWLFRYQEAGWLTLAGLLLFIPIEIVRGLIRKMSGVKDT